MIIIYIFQINHNFKVIHFLFLFPFYFTFLTKETFFLRPFIEHTFLDCKQNVGAGINTLMSIFDGLGPCIFCRNMEEARPMREQMDGKVIYFPPESAFFNFDVILYNVLCPICTLTWRVNIYVSRQKKV